MTPHRRALALASALLPLSLLLVTPAWASSTANEVVYISDADSDGVYSVVLQDLETRRVTTLLPADTNAGFTYDDPKLSPTGDRVVVSSDYQGSASAAPADAPGLIVVNRDGNGFRRLTTGTVTTSGSTTTTVVDSFPAWSPDGTSIVFTRITSTDDSAAQTSTTTTALFTIPAAGGAATAVPGGEHGFTADFNPKDGSQIVFAEPTDVDSGVGPLEVMGTDGSGKRGLGATGALPAWSPDGGTIAYAQITDPSSTAGDVAQIATVPAAGGTPTVFATTKPTSARTVAEYPSWSPDGESILYDFFAYDSTGAPQSGDLWAVDRLGVRAGKFLGGAGDEAEVFAQGPAPAAVQPGAASRYTPVNPKRILDTRSGVGAAEAKVGAGQTIDLQVAGVQTDGGAVPANATAAVLNVTVTDTTGTTDVRVFPTGAPLPGSSNLNAGKSQTVPNLVTATLGTGGKVSIYNSGGTVDLIADLAGWYTPDASGAGFTAVEPRRILDTRPAPDGPVGVASPGPVAAGSPIDLQVTGDLRTAGGGTVTIPSDATAVVLNVTATSASTSTDVRVYPTPTDGSFPVVSNLNLGRSQTTPNLVTVAVGSGGKVRFRNASGNVQLLADIAGYYSASSAGSYVPVVPLRFLDTRSGVGAAPIVIPSGGYDDLKIAGARGVPTGALAAVLNLTATSVSNLSDVRAYPKPTDGSFPVVSNLNPTKGATRANLAIVKPGDDGRVRLRVAGGSLHLIGDLAGYFI